MHILCLTDVRDPVGDVRAFLDQFREKYGEVHPDFYDGSYSQVLKEEKSCHSIINFLDVYKCEISSREMCYYTRLYFINCSESYNVFSH